MFGQVTFKPTDKQLAALERIFTLAEGHGGGALRARSLLCAWWNGAELGGFGFSNLWSFDEQNLEAALVVIDMIGRAPSGTYADAIEGYDERMRALAIRRSRELELGAKFTFERWNESKQDCEPLAENPRFATREEAEGWRRDFARQLSCKPDELQVVPVWDDEKSDA